MTCKQYEAVLVEAARSAAPGDAEHALAHAASCEQCAAKLAAERALTARLRALAATSAGRQASPRVEAALRAAWPRRAATAPAWRSWQSWAVAAAACVVLLAASIFVLKQNPAPSRAGNGAEMTTGFIPLLWTDAADTGEPRQLIRVELPRGSLVSLGIPINQDRALEPVKADVIIGYDGLPRAIRLVRTTY